MAYDKIDLGLIYGTGTSSPFITYFALNAVLPYDRQFDLSIHYVLICWLSYAVTFLFVHHFILNGKLRDDVRKVFDLMHFPTKD